MPTFKPDPGEMRSVSEPPAASARASQIKPLARAAAGLGLFALLIAYYEASPHLWTATIWWDVAWIGFVLIPAVFGLVLIALPLGEEPWLLPAGSRLRCSRPF